MIKKLIALCILLSVSLALGSCEKDGQPEQSFFYEGIVVETITLGRLEGVEVILGDTLNPQSKSLTNGMGKYEIEFDKQVHQITFRLGGSQTKTKRTNFVGFRDSMYVVLSPN